MNNHIKSRQVHLIFPEYHCRAVSWLELGISWLAAAASQLADLSQAREVSKKRPPPAEGGALEASSERPTEAPPEDPNKGAAGGHHYDIWLHFSSQKYDETAKFSTSLHRRNK